MPNTSIKVPVELRDRLSELARRGHTTLAAAITHALDVAETHDFWEQVRASMPERGSVGAGEFAESFRAGSSAPRSGPAPEPGDLDQTLSDGLDPDEARSDVL